MTNNSLIDEGVDASFGSDVRQFLDESTGTTADKDKEFGEVGRACGKRITGIIDDSDVFRGSKDGQSSLDRKREGGEVGDGVVGHAANSSILERDDRAECARLLGIGNH